MENLPMEVLEKIFSHISMKKKVQISAVCRNWSKSLDASLMKNNLALRFRSRLANCSACCREMGLSKDIAISQFVDDDEIELVNLEDHFIENAVEYFINRAATEVHFLSFCANNVADSQAFLKSLLLLCVNLIELECKEFSSAKHGVLDGVVSWLIVSNRSIERLTLKNFTVSLDTFFIESQDSNMAALTHLHLEMIKITEHALVAIFRQCCENLNNLFIDMASVNYAADLISECLSYIPHCKNVTIKNSGFHSKNVVNDENLMNVISPLVELESLSVTCFDGITSLGVKDLLASKVGQTKLQYLDISYCTQVDTTILETLVGRPKEAPHLTVFTVSTEVEEEYEGPSWEIVANWYPEAAMFFGIK